MKEEIPRFFCSPYSKGASVLRMLEDFMGEQFFKLGVSRFLKEHKSVVLPPYVGYVVYV